MAVLRAEQGARVAEETTDAAPAIRLEGVTRTYAAKGKGAKGGGARARVALDSVSLSVPAGQRTALLGPNGSGKSTLLRILSTLDRADSGTVEVLGQMIGARSGDRELRRLRARLGVVFQAPALDKLLTVRENLLAQAALFGLSGRAATERVEGAAARLVITDRLGDRVATLSGGLVRRADLARALLHDPELLLLDEPTIGLDPRAREEFLETLEAVSSVTRGAGEQRGGAAADGGRMTILLSTHLMDEAQRCQRVVMLHEGRVVADDAPARLRRSLGGWVIRVQGAAEHSVSRAIAILTEAGVQAERQASGVVLAPTSSVSGERLESAVVNLTRAGVPFEIGPPTLGDVFMARTGEELAATMEEPETPRALQRRRKR
ncbi:MAG: ABC transporter ATP-binding protein [Phycisphaerales bacterium]|nr:ABC transporter ATP-binding protein [Phycisphaerales bacterium]